MNSQPSQNDKTYTVVDDLEPLYTVDVAAEIIPFPNKQALLAWLSRHKGEFPARYRLTHQPGQHAGSVPQRMLLHSELVRIRAMQLKHYDLSYRGRKPGNGAHRVGNRYELGTRQPVSRSGRTVAGPLAGIIRRAMSSDSG